MLSQGLEVTHICSTHTPLIRILVTWLHLAAGAVCPAKSQLLGEEGNDFGRTARNQLYLGIVGIQSYHCDKTR